MAISENLIKLVLEDLAKKIPEDKPSLATGYILMGENKQHSHLIPVKIKKK